MQRTAELAMSYDPTPHDLSIIISNRSSSSSNRPSVIVDVVNCHNPSSCRLDVKGPRQPPPPPPPHSSCGFNNLAFSPPSKPATLRDREVPPSSVFRRWRPLAACSIDDPHSVRRRNSAYSWYDEHSRRSHHSLVIDAVITCAPKSAAVRSSGGG